MPGPMRESGPDFVVVGSGPDATCSTTVRDGCTGLPMSSSAFAAVFLSGSGALLLKLFNMLASPCGLKCLKLLLELARVRLELLFRRSLRFLRPAELTHAGRPKLRIRRSESIPRQPHRCVRPFTWQGASALHHRDATLWSNSEHFRCCPRTCRPLRDTLGALRWHKAGEARPHVRHETAPVHHAARRRGGNVAAHGARAAASAAGARLPQRLVAC